MIIVWTDDTHEDTYFLRIIVNVNYLRATPI